LGAQDARRPLRRRGRHRGWAREARRPKGTRSPREGQGRGQEGQEAKERLLMWPMREQREEAAAVTF